MEQTKKPFQFTPRNRIILLVLILLSAFLIARFFGLHEIITIEYVRSIFKEYKLIAICAYVALFTIGNLLQIPGFVFLIAAILAVGKIEAAFLAYFAGTISCTISFYVVGLAGCENLRAFENNKLFTRIFNILDEHPIRSMVLLRICTQTSPITNYALAMSGVRYRDYLLGLLLGLPLPIVVYCLLFETLTNF